MTKRTEVAESFKELPQVISMTNEHQIVMILRRMEEKLDRMMYTLEELRSPGKSSAVKTTTERKRNGKSESADSVLKVLADGKPKAIYQICLEINEKKLTSFPVNETSICQRCLNMVKDGRLVKFRKGMYMLANGGVNHG